MEDKLTMDLRETWWDGDWIHLAEGQMAGWCEDGNEPLGSIKDMKCDYLSDYQLLKKDCAPRSYMITHKFLNIKKIASRRQYAETKVLW